ncbi:MAG: hypothetical protein ACXABY_35510 [Candidatus Thorarchaeota archaeon]|jgi:hypothetical protein
MIDQIVELDKRIVDLEEKFARVAIYLSWYIDRWDKPTKHEVAEGIREALQ